MPSAQLPIGPLPYKSSVANTMPAALTRHLPTMEKLASTTFLSSHNVQARGNRGDRPVQHIWLITGPAGCGKSTVAAYLAEAMGLPYLEGDSFHSKANIEKMSSGHPLTDQDRWDWLINLRTAALHTLGIASPSSSPVLAPSFPSNTIPTPPPRAVIVTCSALRTRYRDVLRIATYQHPAVRTHFLFLSAPEAVLIERVTARRVIENHYMGPEMVHSQFESLEEPNEEETDVVCVDVSRDRESVMREALRRVSGRMEGV